MRKRFTQLLFLLATLGWVLGVRAETAWWGDSKLLAVNGAKDDSFDLSISIVRRSGGRGYGIGDETSKDQVSFIHACP